MGEENGVDSFNAVPVDPRIRERRRRLSLDSSLYPAGRGPRLPPSPVAGASRKSMSAVQRAPFTNPFSPKLTPGQAAREFLDKTAKGQLLEIVRESDDSAGAAHHRPRRASLDDLSRVLDKYAKSRQHVFDALKGIKKQEDVLDNKLENNIRRLEGTEHKFQKATKHMETARRNSFAAGTSEYQHLQELQSRVDCAPTEVAHNGDGLADEVKPVPTAGEIDAGSVINKESDSPAAPGVTEGESPAAPGSTEGELTAAPGSTESELTATQENTGSESPAAITGEDDVQDGELDPLPNPPDVQNKMNTEEFDVVTAEDRFKTVTSVENVEQQVDDSSTTDKQVVKAQDVEESSQNVEADATILKEGQNSDGTRKQSAKQSSKVTSPTNLVPVKTFEFSAA